MTNSTALRGSAVIRVLVLLVLAPFLAPFLARAADRTTQHVIALEAGPFAVTAAVETLKLATAEGKPAAEIVTTAFLHEEGGGRPVTFVFNGGPGAASAWLDLGAIGPWRVPLAIPVVPSQDPTPVDNGETWLGFTDLVFIDPPGTGYSRSLADPHAYQSVDGDIQVLATTVRRWLELHRRQAAPVFLAGESYGGFRAPRLARALLEQQGIGVAGLVLISPVLDFNRRDSAYDPVHVAALLPSVAAAHRRARSRAEVADVEAYAAGPYVADLLRGPGDEAAQGRIAGALAGMTGLEPGEVRRRGGRLDLETVLRDVHPGQVGSPYDATLLAADPFPAARRDNSPDPALDGLRGPVSQGVSLLYNRLDWQPEGAPARQYVLLSNSIAHEWDYGRSHNRPESMTALRQYLALDPKARVLVAHGLYDLVTPYFASKLLMDQVLAGDRLMLAAYPGGHMSYTEAEARRALQRDVGAMIARVLSDRMGPRG